MLPLPIQFIIVMIAHAINQRLARRLAYAQQETLVLKEMLRAATGKSKLAFSIKQKRSLALLGKELGLIRFSGHPRSVKRA